MNKLGGQCPQPKEQHGFRKNRLSVGDLSKEFGRVDVWTGTTRRFATPFFYVTLALRLTAWTSTHKHGGEPGTAHVFTCFSPGRF